MNPGPIPLTDPEETQPDATVHGGGELSSDEVLPLPRPGQSGSGGRGLLDRVGYLQATTAVPSGTPGYAGVRERVQARLVAELKEEASTPSAEALRPRINAILDEVTREQGVALSRTMRARVIESIVQDMVGLGPLDDLLKDPSVKDIMVNSAKKVYVEQEGRIHKSPIVFESEQQLRQVIDRIVMRVGRRVDESSPMVDVRLEDGSRVHIIIPPLSLTGATITIRKFDREALSGEDLVRFGTMTEDMLAFVRACVHGRLNIAVSGGGSSGKTTTLNILSGFISETERIVTIEDVAELQLNQTHVVPLETRPVSVEGKGGVTTRDLVINALRMRPDRIVVGECRGGEALDMLQAMNTGHDGSLTTLHANSAKEVVARLETMVLMAGTDLPSKAIREQIGAAINIIVQQARMRDGTRKIMSVTEVTGVVGQDVQMQDIFRFIQTGIGSDGAVMGRHVATGAVPNCLEHLESYGEVLDHSMFNRTEL